MIRPLLSALLLLLLIFGVAGMNALIIQSKLADTAEKDTASEEQEKYTLKYSASRLARRRKSLLPNPPDRADVGPNAEQSVFTSLSPPHSLRRSGNFRGILKVLRI